MIEGNNLRSVEIVTRVTGYKVKLRIAVPKVDLNFLINKVMRLKFIIFHYGSTEITVNRYSDQGRSALK